jgi:hypothetical protein
VVLLKVPRQPSSFSRWEGKSAAHSPSPPSMPVRDQGLKGRALWACTRLKSAQKVSFLIHRSFLVRLALSPPGSFVLLLNSASQRGGQLGWGLLFSRGAYRRELDGRTPCWCHKGGGPPMCRLVGASGSSPPSRGGESPLEASLCFRASELLNASFVRLPGCTVRCQDARFVGMQGLQGCHDARLPGCQVCNDSRFARFARMP